MILGAIDIGSNAARLLITEVVAAPGKPVAFNKLNLVRVPLRLGMDVFSKNEISTERKKMMLSTMISFSHLMDAYGVKFYKACATAAMRSALNGKEILQAIKKESGLTVEIITGQEEAALIYENHVAENLNNNEAYMYIDVGGGSTEITYFYNGMLQGKESFSIGTIRLLQKQVQQTTWMNMKEFIKQQTHFLKNVQAIGSGGNINKVFSLSKKKDGKPLNIELLKDYYKDLSLLSLEQRMESFKLREDRADVIVPALEIYINAMRWANASLIYVPKIGLADGLIQSLYTQLVAEGKA
jgi:exopolyphosphatase / guanosine-5'-triphosphate,3'-diphosphate pyrophosphatase